MKKYMNFLCVLILALTLVYLVVGLFFSGQGALSEDAFSNTTLSQDLMMLVIALVLLGCFITAIVSFVKFILNVNRNKVFTRKNISLIRKYGVSVLLIAVCFILIKYLFPDDFADTLGLASDEVIGTVIEGLFALLMGEVFVIGLNLQEEHSHSGADTL